MILILMTSTYQRIYVDTHIHDTLLKAHLDFLSRSLRKQTQFFFATRSTWEIRRGPRAIWVTLLDVRSAGPTPSRTGNTKCPM